MRILSWFHYAFALVMMLLSLIPLFIGFGEYGAILRESNDPALSFLFTHEDFVIGVSGFIYLYVLGVFPEMYVGWSCRKKSTRPEKLLPTLLLSGIQIIFRCFSLLRAGITAVDWLSVYNLTVNIVTFSLALWMRLEYNRQKARK